MSIDEKECETLLGKIEYLESKNRDLLDKNRFLSKVILGLEKQSSNNKKIEALSYQIDMLKHEVKRLKSRGVSCDKDKRMLQMQRIKARDGVC